MKARVKSDAKNVKLTPGKIYEITIVGTPDKVSVGLATPSNYAVLVWDDEGKWSICNLSSFEGIDLNIKE